MIVFEKCDREKVLPPIQCASQEEITQWMEFRYILTVENQKRFIQHKFKKERIVKSAEIHWHPLNSVSRTDYVKMIRQSAMKLHDDYWGLQSDDE